METKMSAQIPVERFKKALLECLEETFSNVRGIYLDKGRVFASRLRVYRPRDEFLTRSRFARNQNSAVGRRDNRNLFPKRAHRHRFADHFVFVAELFG